MFRKISLAACLAISIFYGCSKEHATQPATPATAGTQPGNGPAHRGTGYSGNYSSPIPVDSANRMIQSYLTSINYPSNDSDLRSMSFDADTLRAYLSNTSIKTVRFMLAHQPDYINSGGFGKYAGMKPGALTFVIVGLGDDGSYQLNSSGQVYEHISPCPSLCDGISSSYIQ